MGFGALTAACCDGVWGRRFRLAGVGWHEAQEANRLSIKWTRYKRKFKWRLAKPRYRKKRCLMDALN